ncbi:hypothetical protein CC1G_08913 [Coprinopsis cinerea okayama7|uniref:DUF6534 domain-containing protein n=1 Tax=Coprinopsis cinerea (strain Okayama-7 / 130 / ATCC MYA-4618 / FGSC 9003) TaxID=240176 RepID=A8P8A9_COPC7|nr:hypothetical protein CC1G_08913 [Coprinopsis cinerea okayama7\|eukprot:XP_001839534.1 hypothetical protein CC1G_08913 [Coprinopsis cinerea okayama7\
MSDAAPEVPLNPALVGGPVLVGAVLSFMLFGALVVQVYTYASNATGSRQKGLHGYVTFMVLFEAVNVCLIFHNAWHSLVLSISNPALVFTPSMSAPVLQIFNAVVATSVQSFFAWRIFILSSKKIEKIASGVVASLAVIGMGFAVSVAAQYFLILGGKAPTANVNLLAGLQLGTHLLCDGIITASMMAVFAGYKERIAIAETKDLLNTLTRNTLENALATTVVASLNLAFFLARPGDLIHVAFHYVIGRLYANVLLTSLNNGRRTGSSGSRGGATSSHSISLSNTRLKVSQAHPGASRVVAMEDDFGRHTHRKDNDVLVTVSSEVYVSDTK